MDYKPEQYFSLTPNQPAVIIHDRFSRNEQAENCLNVVVYLLWTWALICNAWTGDWFENWDTAVICWWVVTRKWANLMHDMPESNACVLCLRYLLTICLPPIQKSWVFSRGIYLYGWNIAGVFSCAVDHPFIQNWWKLCDGAWFSCILYACTECCYSLFFACTLTNFSHS